MVPWLWLNRLMDGCRGFGRRCGSSPRCLRLHRRCCRGDRGAVRHQGSLVYSQLVRGARLPASRAPDELVSLLSHGTAGVAAEKCLIMRPGCNPIACAVLAL